MKNYDIGRALGFLLGFYFILITLTLYFVFAAYIFMSFWNWFLDDITGITINWGVSFTVVLFFMIYNILNTWYNNYLVVWQKQTDSLLYKSLIDNGFVEKK